MNKGHTSNPNDRNANAIFLIYQSKGRRIIRVLGPWVLNCRHVCCYHPFHLARMMVLVSSKDKSDRSPI